MKFNSKLFIPFFTVITAINADPSQLTEECMNEMMNMEKCISQKITKENLNAICEASKTQDCQQFYADPMSFLPSCQNFGELITTSSQIFNNSLSLMCENDETGNICPFTEYELSLSNNNEEQNVGTNPMDTTIGNNDEEALNAIKKTCTSPKCKAATQKYIQFLIDSNNDVTKTIAANYRFASLQNANTEVINKLNSFLEVLNGNECIPASTQPQVPMLNNSTAPNNDTNPAKPEQNSFGITKYITKPMFIISFVIYMALYCLMFKFILI